MDNVNFNIKKIDELKNKIEQMGKLPVTILNKINYKFRLDWNYYSNMMEGNTLTVKETKSVMIGNITINGKPIKDVLEMRAHDETIRTILKIGKGELNISEKRIKEIHRSIMHEDDESKRNEIGQWKKTPNYIYNYQYEKFDFSKPEDVPDEMHGLINWVNAEAGKIKEKKKNALHPSLLAFEFHIRYLTIHPFYDGNGRTARIFMNLILISLGYPPVIIRKEEKEPYYKYIADIQAYNESKELFFEFMLGLLEKSLLLVNDAINGKDIEEPEDIDKEIDLLKQMQNPRNKGLKKTKKVINSTLHAVYFPLLKELDVQLSKFNKLFKKHVWGYFEEPQPPDYDTKLAPTNVSFEYMLAYFKEIAATSSDGDSRHHYKSTYWFLEYNDRFNFNIEVGLKIYFNEDSYSLEVIIGEQLQSSQMFQSIAETIKVFTKGIASENENILGFKKIKVTDIRYSIEPSPASINLWVTDIVKQTLELIKEKASLQK